MTRKNQEAIRLDNTIDRVLIVDDDETVLEMLTKVVMSSDLEPSTASSGEDALELLQKSEYAAMLLDINLHGINGFDVIRQIRDCGNRIPIIIVSGRKEDYDTLYGLGIGADDYITKPFNPVTLGAKLKALIRRSKHSGLSRTPVINAGPFSYDITTFRFSKNGRTIPLTGKENALIRLFMDNLNRIFSKDMIYDMVWGSDIVDDNAIMVYINRLRSKIEDDPSNPKYIQNVRGVGYRFVAGD